jgi:hypothetical protein
LEKQGLDCDVQGDPNHVGGARSEEVEPELTIEID